MKIETNKFKILTPSEGKWLCNRTAKTFSDKVYMTVTADHSQWEEITETEKLRLETDWENDSLNDENENSQYAEAGKILLGVAE